MSLRKRLRRSLRKSQERKQKTSLKGSLKRSLLKMSPAGIPDATCRLTPEGYFYGASGMELSATELMVLGGYLFHAVRTEPYLAQAVSCQIPNERGGYGYFFWVGEDYFYMSGKWGQKCIVSPKTGAVISYVSDRPEGDGELFRLALDYLASLHF